MTTSRKSTAARAPAQAKPEVAAAAPTPSPAAAAPATASKPAAAKAPAARRTQAAAPAKPAREPKAEKQRKPKLVRDSFTIPKSEFAVLQDLKLRAAKLGKPAKKSEILRAGIAALAAMGEPAFLASLSAVPAIKTGRPAKA